MKEPKYAEDGFHQCDNCGEIWHADALRDVEDFSQRVDAGGKVPSGECPGCGTLCYPLSKAKTKKALKEGKCKGFCQEEVGDVVHGRFIMDSEETTCSTCDEAE